jgi:hypothetical protein
VSPTRPIERLAAADVRPGLLVRAAGVQSQSGMTLRSMVVEIWSLHPINGCYWAKADASGRQVVVVELHGMSLASKAERTVFYAET